MFSKKFSCITQLLECLQEWTVNTGNSAETYVIYLDFSKAFDTVPYKRLIYKLRQYGIEGKVQLWIQSFLAGTRQTAVLRNGHSSWRNVRSGVPKGSILGSLLLFLYANDYPTQTRQRPKYLLTQNFTQIFLQ